MTEKEWLQFLKEYLLRSESKTNRYTSTYSTDQSNKKSLYITTNDIEWFMEDKLKNNSENEDLKTKKRIIEEELKNYIFLKLQEFGAQLSEKDKHRTLSFLMYILSDKCRLNNQSYLLNNIIDYVIKQISIIQGYNFEWYIEENEELIKEPVLDIRDGKLFRLVTHEKTEPAASFYKIWEYYKELKIEEERKR